MIVDLGNYVIETPSTLRNFKIADTRRGESGQQRVRAEAAVAHADAVLGGRVRGDLRAVVSVDAEGDDADRVGAELVARPTTRS